MAALKLPSMGYEIPDARDCPLQSSEDQGDSSGTPEFRKCKVLTKVRETSSAVKSACCHAEFGSQHSAGSLRMPGTPGYLMSFSGLHSYLYS